MVLVHIFLWEISSTKSQNNQYIASYKKYTYIAFVCNPPRKMHNVLNKKIRTIKKVDFYTFFTSRLPKLHNTFFEFIEHCEMST